MKQYKPINLVAVLLVSFVAWVYCVAPAVLGLIYQAYPGQDSISVLIATLPTVVTMIVAFLSTVIFRFVPRKWMAITSMVIALICGAVILIFPLPLMGVIICSALLGIPAGIIPAACATTVTIIAPPALKDKVVGWHNALMMLGMTVFTLLAGLFGDTGNFRDGYKSIFFLIPIIILAILFYPNVDRDLSGMAQAAMEQTAAANTANTGKEKIPWYCIAFVLTYLIGCIFWNAWFLNYSDYVINEAQIGGAAVSGMIGSLSSLGGTLAGFFVAWWIKDTKVFSMPLAFVLCGVTMLLPGMTHSTLGCYVGGFLCQMFNLFIVSGLSTYAALATDGKKYATTILALISVAEGAGVFLCGYLVPPLGNLLGGGAGANLTAASVVMILLGVACFFVMKPAHKAVYEQAE